MIKKKQLKKVHMHDKLQASIISKHVNNIQYLLCELTLRRYSRALLFIRTFEPKSNLFWHLYITMKYIDIVLIIIFSLNQKKT